MYVQGARFSNDFVENFFSNIKKKFPVPNALQFKQSLKLFTISQYLHKLPNTNYEQDSGNFLAEFLKFPKKKNKQCVEMCVLPPEIETKVIKLNNLELNSLYYVCGYIISSISKNQKICQNCIDSAGCKTYDPNITYSRLVSLKCYKKNTLFFVNKNTFHYFKKMNVIIKKYLPYVKKFNGDIVSFFITKMTNINCNSLQNCHALAHKIKVRFIKFMIKQNCRPARINKPVYNSKTMAMYNAFK